MQIDMYIYRDLYIHYIYRYVYMFPNRVRTSKPCPEDVRYTRRDSNSEMERLGPIGDLYGGGGDLRVRMGAN